MSQSTERVPFRTKLRVEVGNFLQKYRPILLSLVVFAIVLVGGLAIWTQVDSATKTTFAAQIEKSQNDFSSWQSEIDSSKKADFARSLEKDLLDIQKNAPEGYGLSKAWFIQGNYFASQKKWPEAAKAFHTVFEKDPGSYLAPISLVNSGVSLEENGDGVGALAAYADFEKNFSTDSVLAPQVYFTQGRVLESLGKVADAVSAYKKLLAKFPESGWTKLGRDRIIFLSQE